ERQRIAGEQRRLPTEQMEVLRRSRAVHETQVDVRGSLKEALRAACGMIRSLAFVRVGKQQDQRWAQTPLGASRRDELVEDDLRAVDEIAVLRLPDDQAVRLLHVVAELESDRRVLRQRAVVNFETGRGLRKRLQRDERVAGCRVVQHRVTL